MTGGKTFGEWLYRARRDFKRKDGKRGGLTQKELAEMLGVDNSYIGKLERGGGEPSRELLAKISNRFDVSFDLLLQYAGREPEPKVDSVSAEALRLYELVRRVPKKNIGLAVRLLESLANDDDGDGINAHDPRSDTDSNIQTHSTRKGN